MRLLLIVLGGAIALAAGVIVYLIQQEGSPTPAPVTESAPPNPAAGSARITVDKAQTVSPDAEQPVRVSDATAVTTDATPDRTTTPTPLSSLVNETIATLVSPKASFQQKQSAWKRLIEAGELDQAIEALKQGAAGNPTSAAYPAALGQAQLQKAGVIAQKGATISEMGILGMQADQSFDTALKLEPNNWEAQFFKAAAMSHWPLELNKGEEVVQRLSHLIDQQDGMSPEPQFAQTYVLLGDQYQKMGRPDYAVATWQIGAQKFPANPALQQKISGN